MKAPRGDPKLMSCWPVPNRQRERTIRLCRSRLNQMQMQVLRAKLPMDSSKKKKRRQSEQLICVQISLSTLFCLYLI